MGKIKGTYEGSLIKIVKYIYFQDPVYDEY